MIKLRHFRYINYKKNLNNYNQTIYLIFIINSFLIFLKLNLEVLIID